MYRNGANKTQKGGCAILPNHEWIGFPSANLMTLEEYKKEAFEIFDAGFMSDEDVEDRAAFKKCPDVNTFLTKAYREGCNRDTVDTCLGGLWDYWRSEDKI